jgi:lysophospholipid acyltransferase (LPLAT)-like uncharacterized protein
MSGILQSFLAFVGSLYIRLVGVTSRVSWVNRAVRTNLELTGKGFIYACWHGRQMFLLYLHENDQARPLISKSKDGDLIAKICRHFGLNAVRGSSSRGGMKAVLELKSTLESGMRVGFTPDGPRGPFHEVQHGVLYVAQKLGCPILPFAYGARKSWVFGSWDKFIVPKLFNRIAIIYGEPFFVHPGDNLSAISKIMQKKLNDVTLAADRFVALPQPA